MIFDAVKNRINITDIAAKHGLEVDRKIDCIFCGYKNSFHIRSEGYYNCFHCNEKGDLFNLHAYLEKCDTTEAARQLASDLGINYRASRDDSERETRSERLKNFLNQFPLQDSGRKYLKSRGLTDEYIDYYQFFQLSDDLPAMKGDNYLAEIGLYWTKNEKGMSGVAGYLIVPFWRGRQIVYVTGRAIDNREPKYKNIKGKKSLLGQEVGTDVTIVEGIFDFLLIDQEIRSEYDEDGNFVRFKNPKSSVIATAGSGNMPELSKKVDTIRLAFDPDEAGKKYTEKFIENYHGSARILIADIDQDPADMISAGKKIQYESAFRYFLKQDAIRYDLIFKTVRSLQEIDRENVFKEIKKRTGASIAAIKKDYNSSLHDESGGGFESNDNRFSVPEGYTLDDTGVTYDGARITHSPLFISATGADLAAGTEFVKLNYRYRGIDRSKVVRLDEVADYRKLLQYSQNGVPVNSANAVRVTEYVSAFLSTNISLDTFKVISRLGWVGKNIFLLPDCAIEKKEASMKSEVVFHGSQALSEAYATQGSLARWVETVASINREESWPVRFALYASFASALWGRLGLDPFFVHYHGRSSRGKTMTLRVAASVWGSPEKGKALLTWETTKNFLPRYAATLNNLPLILDEISGKDNNNWIRQVVYTLTNGTGKALASANDPTAVVLPKQFNPIMLSSGEMAINADSALGGQIARVLDLYGEPFGFDDEKYVDNVRSFITANHGFAGRHFLREMIDTDIDFYEDRPEIDLAKSNIEKRILKQILIVMNIAKEVERVFEFGFNVSKDREYIVGYVLETDKEENDTKNIHGHYVDFFNEHRKGFVTLRKGRIKNDVEFIGREYPSHVYGYILYDDTGKESKFLGVGFMKSVFNRIAKDAISTINAGQYAFDRLSEEGLLYTDRHRVAGGKSPKLNVINGIYDDRGGDHEKTEVIENNDSGLFESEDDPF